MPGAHEDRRESADPSDAGEPKGSGDQDEDEVDEASEESFPASDAPASWSGPPDR